MTFARCSMCRRPLQGKSAKRTFCSSACRQRAYRRRRDGLPEQFMAEGAGAMGRRSLAEQRQRIQQISELLAVGASLTHADVSAILGRR
jgi:hypothetical protein